MLWLLLIYVLLVEFVDIVFYISFIIVVVVAFCSSLYLVILNCWCGIVIKLVCVRLV